MATIVSASLAIFASYFFYRFETHGSDTVSHFLQYALTIANLPVQDQIEKTLDLPLLCILEVVLKLYQKLICELEDVCNEDLSLKTGKCCSLFSSPPLPQL